MINLQNAKAFAKKEGKTKSSAVVKLEDYYHKQYVNVNPFNYDCDFNRLTWLFNRGLQIKLYKSKLNESADIEA